MILGISLARAGVVALGDLAVRRRWELMEWHGVKPSSRPTVDGRSWDACVVGRDYRRLYPAEPGVLADLIAVAARDADAALLAAGERAW